MYFETDWSHICPLPSTTLSSAATPFCLPTITLAPSELNPEHLVSGIEHSALIASAITSAVPEVSSKTVRKDVLHFLYRESKYLIYALSTT